MICASLTAFYNVSLTHSTVFM